MRVAAVCLAALLITACTAEEAPEAPFSEPRWTRTSVPTLQYEQLPRVRGAAGWQGGFAVASERADDVPVVHMSADGATWRRIVISGLTELGQGDAVAGHGKHGYLLGEGFHGPTVWTSEGDVWYRIPLPGARSGDLVSSISAGPRGVVVVGFGPMTSIATADALRIWHSADGERFGEPVDVPMPGVYPYEPPLVTATDHGFLIYRITIAHDHATPALLESGDGRTWRDVGPQLIGWPAGVSRPKIDAATHNGGMAVAFTNTADPVHEEDRDRGLTAWYRQDGDTAWTATASIAPGRLPDAGVVPRWQRTVHQVIPWHSGFLALGWAGGAALWTSADGVTWAKTPVRDNGFDQAEKLGFLSNGTVSLLLRTKHKLTGPTEMWRHGDPAGPARGPGRALLPGGSWSQHSGRIVVDDAGAGKLFYRGPGDTAGKYRTVQVRTTHTAENGTRTLEVTASDDPAAPIGAVFQVRVVAPGAVVLHPDGLQAEFCDTDHDREC